jgi:hypothetical protein
MLVPAIINQFFEVQKYFKENMENTGNTLKQLEISSYLSTTGVNCFATGR